MSLKCIWFLSRVHSNNYIHSSPDVRVAFFVGGVGGGGGILYSMSSGLTLKSQKS